MQENIDKRYMKRIMRREKSGFENVIIMLRYSCVLIKVIFYNSEVVDGVKI